MSADPRKAFEITDADRRWQARIDAAKAAVSEAERQMMKADSPREQTYAYRELCVKKQALRIVMLSR